MAAAARRAAASRSRRSAGAGAGRRAAAGSRLAVRVAAAAKPWADKDARLVLEDGSVWHGVGFGAKGTRVAELVFNTSLTGYQEILTDPSYKEQFVLFTCPHIGNVGINPEDMESGKVHLSGIVIRDLARQVSNYRSDRTLSDYLNEAGAVGITEVDTRELTRKLRDTGCLNAVISTDAGKSDAELVEMAKGWSILGKDLISEVTCAEPYDWVDPTDEEWEFSGLRPESGAEPLSLVAYDFGVKSNILRRLAAYGCNIRVVPASFPAEEVLALNPDGVLFSNGPGDPSAVPYAVENAKLILGKVPAFGICMGHQVMGQAFGSSTFKLPFGHHGGNHPVRHGESGRVEISSQNHNYAVDPDKLPEGVVSSIINLNDGTCAGMTAAGMKAMSIQYHPEASPGPHDSDPSFNDFVQMMREYKASK